MRDWTLLLKRSFVTTINANVYRAVCVQTAAVINFEPWYEPEALLTLRGKTLFCWKIIWVIKNVFLTKSTSRSGTIFLLRLRPDY
jgi:hypothetical protein